ncbi:MAG TPA: branched-chain amino acid ABC transporter substrate-binding protein [Burkholderiaceae bacterium]|nr:branched-chain amino acid ABC transporter substrate-binding protein [Burkholderiaceae bacterium]
MTSFNRSKAIFLIAATTALSACGPRIPETLTIAVAQPLSGPSAARGQDLLNGAKLAIDEINKTGFKIAGKPVTLELVSADDKADPVEAKKTAESLVERKVFAVLGHLSSDVTEATIPIYKQGDVIQIFTSSASELTKQGEGNTFRLVANDELQAKAVVGYLSDTLRAKKVAIIHEDTAFGNPMRRDIAAALKKVGASLEAEQAVSNKVTDFAAFVAKLKAAPPDVLVAVLRDPQLIPLGQQLREAGLSDLKVIGTNSAKTTKLVKAPADIKTLYLTSSALEPGEFTGGSAFTQKFRAEFKSDPVWGAHYAYDAIYVLAHTLRSVGSADKAAVRAKLHTIDAMAPVTSTMRFNAAGEQLYGAITVYERRGGAWVPLVRSDQW